MHLVIIMGCCNCAHMNGLLLPIKVFDRRQAAYVAYIRKWLSSMCKYKNKIDLVDW